MTDTRAKGILNGLVLTGEVIGLWVGIGIGAWFGGGTACVVGGVFTLAAALKIALDARKAWKEHDREHYSG